MRRLLAGLASRTTSSLDQTHSTAERRKAALHLSRLILVDRDKSLEGRKYDASATAPLHSHSLSHSPTQSHTRTLCKSSVTPAACAMLFLYPSFVRRSHDSKLD